MEIALIKYCTEESIGLQLYEGDGLKRARVFPTLNETLVIDLARQSLPVVMTTRREVQGHAVMADLDIINKCRGR
jgi:hypothetical protein